MHGSPRRINEFLFASTSPAPFLEVMLERERCDGDALHPQRPAVAPPAAVGRATWSTSASSAGPANDGRTNVWYAVLEARDDSLGVELVPLDYDHEALAAEMRAEELPEEFVETVTSGWWTTCLEILPARERAASRF